MSLLAIYELQAKWIAIICCDKSRFQVTLSGGRIRPLLKKNEAIHRLIVWFKISIGKLLKF